MSGPRVVVIGAGLAGLVAAKALVDHGVRTTVVARGLGGLSLSPGVIDLVGYAPGRVGEVGPGIDALVERCPGHPYSRIPLDAVLRGLDTLRSAVEPTRIQGSHEHNMLVPTMVGAARPTAFAPAAIAAGAIRPGARYLMAGFAAMRDNPVAMCAANLPRAAAACGIEGVTARSVLLSASPRPGEPDVGGVAVARAMDDPAFVARVAAELRPHVGDADLVGLPAVLGLTRTLEIVAELGSRVGARVFEVITIPPSVPGTRMDLRLRQRLAGAGCRIVLGPTVVGLARDGDRVTGVRLDSGGVVTSEPADAVVLATGGLASGAIHIDSHGRLHETVADLPLRGDPGHGARFDERADGHHPGMAVGVAVDGEMRVVDAEGRPWAENLFAAGGVIGGALPWRELSGEGICLGSASLAADAAHRRLQAATTTGGSS